MNRWLGVLLLLVCSSSAVLANEELLGRWTGGLTCGPDKNLPLTLSITEARNGKLKGVFEFRSGWHKAKYHVVGTTTSTGAFQLDPGPWIMQPTGFRAVGLQGQVARFGSRPMIQGTLLDCNGGSFTAFLQPPPEEPPPPPLAKMFDRKGPQWIKAVRDRVQEYVRKRVDKPRWWNQLEREVGFSKVDQATRETLLAEVREARADVRADALLQELASGPKEFPQGIGRALFIFRQAQTSEWPDKTKLRVYKACQKQVAEVLRPKLTEIAALAANLPTTLEGLAEARAAIAPMEDYRHSLEQAFGTLDQENLLSPMLKRIAELELNPAIAIAFREALAVARQQSDPRTATENVIYNVLGQASSSYPLAAIAAEGRKLAALAEVVVESIASEGDRSEPSASDMAAYMFTLVERFNAPLAAMRCAPGQHDVTDLPRCQLGELEARLKKIVKSGCQAEKPGQQYVCDFNQYSQLVYFRTGEPPVDSFALSTRFPGGRMEGPQKVRFVRQVLGGGWVGSRASPE
ncbi:hypothetical protein WHT83_03845 [Aminobacter sp. P9b]|uniref:hypothetical protein n=1 Tax=Aminobacter sp. P9b TaxID=3133697 RepID=UPI00324DBF56